tara:strand:+ start:3188 stop:3799 length:612 start_codon:yes stop_codon:yes gene_type:complete
MILSKLFSTPVAAFKLNHLDTEQKSFLLNTEVGNNSNPYLGNVASNNNYILNQPELESLKKNIQDCINKYKEEVMSCDQELYVTNSWVNFLQPGTKHSMHHHSNSVLSGVYYIKTDDKTPNLRLEHPNTHLWPLCWERKKFNHENSLGEVIVIEDNMLILFPSSIWHSVELNTSSITRVSLSFNTFLKGDISGNNYLADLKLS